MCVRGEGRGSESVRVWGEKRGGERSDGVECEGSVSGYEGYMYIVHYAYVHT